MLHKIILHFTFLQGSCHSNCQYTPLCAGSRCTVHYLSTSVPLQMFNDKKSNFTGENDRSNLISVKINGAEQC